MGKTKKRPKFVNLKDYESKNSNAGETPKSDGNRTVDTDSSMEINHSSCDDKSRSLEKFENSTNSAAASKFEKSRSNKGNSWAKRQPQNPGKTPYSKDSQRPSKFYKSDDSRDHPQQNTAENKTDDEEYLADGPIKVENKRNNAWKIEDAYNARPSTSEISQNVSGRFSGTPDPHMNIEAQVFIPRRSSNTEPEVKSALTIGHWDDGREQSNKERTGLSYSEKLTGGHMRNKYKSTPHSDGNKTNYNQSGNRDKRNHTDKGSYRTEGNIVNTLNQGSTEDDAKVTGKVFHRKNDHRRQDGDNFSSKTDSRQEHVSGQSDYRGKKNFGNKGGFRAEPNSFNTLRQISGEDKSRATGEEYARKDDHRRHERNDNSNDGGTYNRNRPSSNYNSEHSMFNRSKRHEGKQAYEQKHRQKATNNWDNKDLSPKRENKNTESWDDTEDWDNESSKHQGNSNTDERNPEQSWNEQSEGSEHIDKKDVYEQNNNSNKFSWAEEYEKEELQPNNVQSSQGAYNSTFGNQNYDQDNTVSEDSNQLHLSGQDQGALNTSPNAWGMANPSSSQTADWIDTPTVEMNVILNKTKEIDLNAVNFQDTDYQNKFKDRRSAPNFGPKFPQLKQEKFRYSDQKIERPGANLFDKSFEKEDQEYNKYKKECSSKELNYGKTEEKQQDLFMMPKDYSLAHCVAEDFRMGSGIAVQFKRDFKEVATLLAQRQKQGGLAVLENKTEGGIRYIYYLVTKTFSTGKPTYEIFWSALKKMRDHIHKNNVTKLAIPRIGCGLDRLEWSKVKSMIEYLFKDVDIHIVVCNFQQIEDSSTNSPQKYYSTCKVVNVTYPLVDIEAETMILYFTTEKGESTTEMEKLNAKFPFMGQHNSTPKRLGTVIKYEKTKNYVLYGCVVRKTVEDPFDFASFAKCLGQINIDNKKDKYVYVGITQEEDVLLNEQILTLMKDSLKRVDIYVCKNSGSSSN